MHLHKYEKIWLTVGMISLILFLSIIGISAFSHHNMPAGGMMTIDPKKVDRTPPFDHPGVRQIDKNTYQVAIVAKTFGYQPTSIRVPVGKEIRFKLTSSDVTHSFTIIDTTVNMMVVPGQINTKRYTFKKPGKYLIICNEYCGSGHHFMQTEIEVYK